MKKTIISVMAVLLLNGAVTAAADEANAPQKNTSVSAGAGLEPEIITFDYDTDSLKDNRRGNSGCDRGGRS